MGFITINHHHYRRGNRKLLKDIFSLLKTIHMDQTQLAQELRDLKAQNEKSWTELSGKFSELNGKINDLETAVQNAGLVTPEVQEALAEVKQTTQAIDDLVPDVTPAEGNGEEAQG